MSEEWQFKTCRLWQTIGKSGDQRRGTLLYREKDDIGKGCFEGVRREVAVQDGDGLSLEILPPAGAV